MANKFCRFLGNQLRLDLDGISPCCYYKKRLEFHDKTQFNNFYNNLLNQNSWTDDCLGCKEKEDKGLISPRQYSLSNYNFYCLNNENEPDELTSLEIQTDIDCNSACLICGPSSSTTWQKFEKKFDPTIKIIDNKKADAIKKFKIAKEICDFSKLKNIGFVNGGEPLKSKTHLLYLREMNNLGYLKNINISYVTNGSIQPSDETIDLWRKAKSVNLFVSIDGIDEHFNYLRWPLNFEQIKKNISFMLDLKIKGNLSFSYAITPLNVFYHDTYQQWGQEFFKNYTGPMQIGGIFDHPFQTYGDINLNCVPVKLRIALIKKYGLKHPINLMIKSFIPNQYKNFMNYVKIQDERRGLNFRKVFPEIEHFFN